MPGSIILIFCGRSVKRCIWSYWLYIFFHIIDTIDSYDILFSRDDNKFCPLCRISYRVPVRPVKQVPMGRLCNQYCWGRQLWAHSRPPQHLWGTSRNDTERPGFVYWNLSVLPIYHLWHQNMLYFDLFSHPRPQYKHHCSGTRSSCPWWQYRIDIHWYHILAMMWPG